MIWASVLMWIAAFAMLIVGIVVYYQTAITDFEPWEHAKRRLILVGILVTGPGYVLGFHFLPTPLAIVLSLVATSLAVLHFTMVAPKKWRRVMGKRK